MRSGGAGGLVSDQDLACLVVDHDRALEVGDARFIKALNLTTLILVIVGGINWGLVGVAEWNLVAAIFGDGSARSRIVHTLVGLSALWQLVLPASAFHMGEVLALHGQSAR